MVLCQSAVFSTAFTWGATFGRSKHGQSMSKSKHIHSHQNRYETEDPLWEDYSFIFFWVWLSALFIIQSNHLTLCRYQAISSRARQQNFAPQGISKLDSARSLDTLTVLNIQTWENDKDLNNGCKNGILPNQITFQLEVWKIVDHKNHLATDSQIANFDPLELLTFTNPALT